MQNKLFAKSVEANHSRFHALRSCILWEYKTPTRQRRRDKDQDQLWYEATTRGMSSVLASREDGCVVARLDCTLGARSWAKTLPRVRRQEIG